MGRGPPYLPVLYTPSPLIALADCPPETGGTRSVATEGVEWMAIVIVFVHLSVSLIPQYIILPALQGGAGGRVRPF